MYQVITYSHAEGSDSKLEYKSLSDAKKTARAYMRDPYYYAVCIADLEGRRVAAEYGEISNDDRPRW